MLLADSARLTRLEDKMKELYYAVYKYPAGNMEIGYTDSAICSVNFTDKPAGGRRSELSDRADAQLREYFAGQRKTFELPLDMQGTPFRMKVWQALQEIPYGETKSYRDIAVRVGNPKAMRAVGGANHNNPISIIVPCHRVVGADGSLVGYGGGLDKKTLLLDMERQYK